MVPVVVVGFGIDLLVAVGGGRGLVIVVGLACLWMTSLLVSEVSSLLADALPNVTVLVMAEEVDPPAVALKLLLP
jgi:hypothetical protein